jgi:cytochrome c-type biogenesis protein CcmF
VATIGTIAILLALALAAFSTVGWLFGKGNSKPELLASAHNAVLVTAGLTTIAVAALLYALFTRDFSIEYVAEYTSRDTSALYTFTGLWAGQAGSLLFWAWLVSLFAAVALLQFRRSLPELLPYAMAVMMAVTTFFLALLAVGSPPFERLEIAAVEGRGLNPLLENIGMVLHPPPQLIGFVGFTVPFAFAIAALVTGRLGDRWIRATRGWTLFAWLFLSLGNLAGMEWAYVELGWGGFWGWDPVENAALMPWLTGTAFLHSVMIQQRRGMMKVWNMFLIISTFALAILGTFLTRSGVLSSVHSFGLSVLGPAFVVFLLVTLVGSFGLLYYRLPQLRSESQLDALLSRESTFLLNNLFFVGAAFAMLWGTLFPLLSEAVRGVKVTVGPPFYEQVIGPMFLGLIVIMGVCPLIGWRRASGRNLARNFALPFSASIALAVVFVSLGLRDLWAVLAFWAISFVALTLVLEFYRGVRVRHRHFGESYLRALPSLIWSNRPRYGGYIVHIGIILLAMGVSASLMYSTSAEATLAPGESMDVGRYTLRFDGLSSEESALKETVSARLTVFNGDAEKGTITSEKYFPRRHPNAVTEVGIRTTPREDLYVILIGWDESGVASFKALVNPLVMWIWIGGTVALIGTVVAMWPRRRDEAPEVGGERRQRVGVANE